MSSLAERLRARSDRRPIYNLDESDDERDLKHGKSGLMQGDIEKIVRSDAKEDSCQACGQGANLLSCATCTYAYHPKCLLPKLKAPFPEKWWCPECLSPLNDIEKILDCEMRPAVAGESGASNLGPKQVSVKQYLVKWKGLSYLHCTWCEAFSTYPCTYDLLHLEGHFTLLTVISTNADCEWKAQATFV